MPLIYFITHPEVLIDPDVLVPEWPLNEIGRRRTLAMTELPWIKDIELIYSSEEVKAHQTAEIVAEHLHKEIFVHSKLGEIDRSSTGYLGEREHDLVVKEFFDKPQKSIRGWETAVMAQRRIVNCVKDIVETNPNTNIAIFSHGGVGALLMAHYKKVPIHKRYAPAQLGSYFIYDFENDEVKQEWRSIG